MGFPNRVVKPQLNYFTIKEPEEGNLKRRIRYMTHNQIYPRGVDHFIDTDNRLCLLTMASPLVSDRMSELSVVKVYYSVMSV